MKLCIFIEYNFSKSVRHLTKMKMYAELIRNYKNYMIKNLQDNTMYLTGDYKTAFNKGKQEEVKDRVKHVKKF